MKQLKNKTFQITATTNGNSNFKELPFASIKEDILGKGYELSLAFVTPKEAQKLNVTHRNKEYVPNILSFPLDETAGEIVICPSVAKKQAPLYERSFENFLIYLFIHGCFHLKGHVHGHEMEREEKRVREEYGV